jgi:hypothetical protein
MRLIGTMVVLILVVLMPALAFAGGGQLSIGGGPECGHGGFNYEFKGKQMTPTVGVGFGSTVLGANWYLTDKTKHNMPRGWRVQGLGGYVYTTGGLELALTAGQRTGNWDWGVGLAWFSGADSGSGGSVPGTAGSDISVGGISVPDNGIMPAWQWAFHF